MERYTEEYVNTLTNDFVTKIKYPMRYCSVLAGCDYDMRKQIMEEVKKHIAWKHIYVLRVSATISCNSGAGTFGMAFFNK